MAVLFDVKLMLVLAIVIVYHMKDTNSYGTCNPEEQCHFPGVKVSNPLDKYSYFLCVEDGRGTVRPSDVPLKCPENTTFTPYSGGLCEKGDWVYWDSCINVCDGECKNYHYERIANINDCSSFYTCLPGNKKVETKCPPEDPYFDGKRCQKSKYLCCTCCDECSIFCHRKFSEIADPFDCKSFYICFEDGFLRSWDKYRCEEGKYFNRFKGRCEIEDKNNPCVPSCKNETIYNKTKNEKPFPK